jgi:hypothetical protein
MDNRTLDIVSEGSEALAMALKLAWPSAPGGKATHYKMLTLVEKVEYYGQPATHHVKTLKEDPKGVPTLILFWSAERDSTPLPYPMPLDQAITFVQGWLKQTDYGEEPDHDGNNHKGWRVFTESWGLVMGHHYTIVAVQPEWAMYGK